MKKQKAKKKRGTRLSKSSALRGRSLRIGTYFGKSVGKESGRYQEFSNNLIDQIIAQFKNYASLFGSFQKHEALILPQIVGLSSCGHPKNGPSNSWNMLLFSVCCKTHRRFPKDLFLRAPALPQKTKNAEKERCTMPSISMFCLARASFRAVGTRGFPGH